MSTNHPGRLQDKKAFITGAAGGLGKAMAQMFARQGAKVFVTDLDATAIASVAEEINREAGGTVAWSAAQDVRDEVRWLAVLDEAAKAMGGISVLVNNAGIGALGGVESLEPRDWRRVMDINVEAVYLGCKHAMKFLKESTPASIVNISSLAAHKVDPNYTVYNTSKAAVAMLSKSIAVDCAKQKVDIRCNSIHPAFIRTGIVEPFFKAMGEEEATKKLIRGVPMARLGDPDDVAYAAVYLASNESRFVTAAEMLIDGGAAAV